MDMILACGCVNSDVGVTLLCGRGSCELWWVDMALPQVWCSSCGCVIHHVGVSSILWACHPTCGCSSHFQVIA